MSNKRRWGLSVGNAIDCGLAFGYVLLLILVYLVYKTKI